MCLPLRSPQSKTRVCAQAASSAPSAGQTWRQRRLPRVYIVHQRPPTRARAASAPALRARGESASRALFFLHRGAPSSLRAAAGWQRRIQAAPAAGRAPFRGIAASTTHCSRVSLHSGGARPPAAALGARKGADGATRQADADGTPRTASSAAPHTPRPRERPLCPGEGRVANLRRVYCNTPRAAPPRRKAQQMAGLYLIVVGVRGPLGRALAAASHGRGALGAHVCTLHERHELHERARARSALYLRKSGC